MKKDWKDLKIGDRILYGYSRECAEETEVVAYGSGDDPIILFSDGWESNGTEFKDFPKELIGKKMHFLEPDRYYGLISDGAFNIDL